MPPLMFLDDRLEWRDGIAIDRRLPASGQDGEHEMRDAVAAPYLASRDLAVKAATRHHSRGVMLRRAAQEVARAKSASPQPVVVDLGCGFGWHWMELARTNPGVQFVLVDFALTNLLVARNLMPASTHPNVTCLQASITDLPMRDGVAHLAWTVQVLQHLPSSERAKAFAEMQRILARGGRYYMAWVRPVPLVRAVRALFGRGYHTAGVMSNGMLLDRFGEEVERELRRFFADGSVARSESLFHPDLKLRAGSGAAAVVDLALSATPLGHLLARQAEFSGFQR